MSKMNELAAAIEEATPASILQNIEFEGREWPSRTGCLRDIISEYGRKQGKSLGLDNDKHYRGSKAFKLKCDTCNAFYIVGRQRKGAFRVVEYNLNHMNVNEATGEQTPCISTYKASKRDLVSDPTFVEMVRSHTEQPTSTKDLQSFLFNTQGIVATTDVVKKAAMEIRTTMENYQTTKKQRSDVYDLNATTRTNKSDRRRCLACGKDISGHTKHRVGSSACTSYLKRFPEQYSEFMATRPDLQHILPLDIAGLCNSGSNNNGNDNNNNAQNYDLSGNTLSVSSVIIPSSSDMILIQPLLSELPGNPVVMPSVLEVATAAIPVVAASGGVESALLRLSEKNAK